VYKVITKINDLLIVVWCGIVSPILLL